MVYVEQTYQKLKLYVQSVMHMHIAKYTPCHHWWRIQNLKLFEALCFIQKKM